MSQNSKTAKMVFGAILPHAEFETGAYKTSHPKYLKNITVGLYPKHVLSRTITEIQPLIGWKSQIFPPSHLAPSFVVIPFELIEKLYGSWNFQTADGEDLVILACTIFDWSTSVMDGRMDGIAIANALN